MSIKKTVKVVREFDPVKFESRLQELINLGFEVKFANGYENNQTNTYFAMLINEEDEPGIPLPISGGR